MAHLGRGEYLGYFLVPLFARVSLSAFLGGVIDRIET
jgi:hypothetical protein